MKIKLDDKHYLNSDQYCYWITELITGKTDSTRKPYERRCSGYTRTFSEAVDSFIEMKIKGSETSDFTNLVKEIDQLKKQVKKWKCAVERGTNDA